MKKIALFLSVVIATAMADTAAAKPDTLSIDKTYDPGRRAFYELMPVKKHNIVMLGNSLTERGLWGEYFQPAYVLNRGIGGDCVSGMIARLETILSGKPKAMFIMAGTNDLIFSKTSYEKLLEQYERMLDIIARESPRTKVYIQSLLPLVEDRQDYFKGKNKRIAGFNAVLREMAERRNLPYIDIWSAIQNNGALPEEFTHDGIHLTGPGYAVWVETLRPYMKPYMKK